MCYYVKNNKGGNMTIQEKIIDHLAKTNLSQSQFADKCNISCGYLSGIMNGRKPSNVLKRKIELIIENK
jgi:transcriptional regulator with XRE-family HTH domain